MKPFHGFSDKERMFFAMLHDRSELEASLKEGSLLLLGELEYLLLIDNPDVEIEWSMEMGKDYFSFPVPLTRGGTATCYVGFDYDRGFFPCLSNDRSDAAGKAVFLDALARNRARLAELGTIVDPDGAASIEGPGTPVEKVSDADIDRWKKAGADVSVGRIFNPADDAFKDRSILRKMHGTVQSMIRLLCKS